MFAGMQEMLVNMLKEALPQELVEMLTPEKMNELGEKITAFVVDVRERLDKLERNDGDIVKLLTSIEMKLLEIKGNDTSDSAGGTRKPPVRSRRKRISTD